MAKLYLKDCYKKEFDTIVKSVKDKFVVLNDTLFYPNAGGQPYDTGILQKDDGTEFNVTYVGKFDGDISHEVDKKGLSAGDKVHGVIDWDRRYKFMKMHTAAHVLARVIYNESGANTSGNQLGLERSRIDFTLEEFDRSKIPVWFEHANEIIGKGLLVKKTFMKKEDALKIPGFAGPSPHLMKDLDVLRVVDIDGFDIQPCGGTHLDNLGEIGKIVFVKSENKGKHNRRIYYTVVS